MKKIIILLVLATFSTFMFSQKISLTSFSHSDWHKVYEDNSMEFYYKLFKGSSVKENTNNFVVFKIVNKQNTSLVLNIDATMEYFGFDETISRQKTIEIPANTTIAEKYNGTNLRVPYTKRKDPNKILKSLKIYF